jgi:hypothetical protein
VNRLSQTERKNESEGSHLALLSESGILIAMHLAVTDGFAICFVGVHGPTQREVAVIVFSLQQQLQEGQNETYSVS